MAQLTMNLVRCEALFASGLQPSDCPTSDTVGDAITGTVRELGLGGCAGRMAQEFGDHPDEARGRMQWARRLVAELCATSPAPAIGYARAA